MTNPPWKPWVILASVFLLNAGFFGYSIAPASVFPLIMDAYSIDKTAASISISAVFLTWALLQIPGGYLLDRYDNRQLLFLATLVFIFASIAGLLVGPYAWFLFTRLLSGASAVFIFVGSVNILGQVLPDARKALGLSLFVASPPSGIVVAQSTGPRIAAMFGWKTPMLAYTLVSLVGLLACLAVLRRPVVTVGGVTVQQFGRALRNPSILLVSITSFCTYAVWTYLITWMPTYGNEVLGIDLAAAGAATALVPLAGIVSRPSGGWLSDRLGGRLQPVIMLSFLATILFLYLLSIAPSPTAFAVLLALAGAGVNLAVGLYLVYVNALADVDTQGTSLSVLITFSQVGNLVAPVVGGFLIDRISWTVSFGFAAALAIVGLITIVLAPPTR